MRWRDRAFGPAVPKSARTALLHKDFVPCRAGCPGCCLQVTAQGATRQSREGYHDAAEQSAQAEGNSELGTHKPHGQVRSMVTVELTIEEAQAIANFIWGNPVDKFWFRSAVKKITTAIDEADPGRTARRAYIDDHRRIQG